MAFLQKLYRFNNSNRCLLQSFCHKLFYTTSSSVKKINNSFTPSTCMMVWPKIEQHQFPGLISRREEPPFEIVPWLRVPVPKIEPNVNREIIEPLTDINKYEKQAVRLIVIRRHKMRKHKLRKLRKRMKFEWAKRRQRREMRKEKTFQAVLIAQIKEAEAFSAEKYVEEKIEEATRVPIPRFWKGKRLPEFIIREKLGLPPK